MSSRRTLMGSGLAALVLLTTSAGCQEGPPAADESVAPPSTASTPTASAPVSSAAQSQPATPTAAPPPTVVP